MLKKLLIVLFICTLSVNFVYAEQKEDKNLKKLTDTITNSLNSRNFIGLYNKYYTESAKKILKLGIDNHKEEIKKLKSNKELYGKLEENFEKDATPKLIPHYTFKQFVNMKKDKDIYNFFMNLMSLDKILTKDFKELKSVKFIFMGAESYDENKKILTYNIEAETDKGLITEIYKLEIKKEKGKWLINNFSGTDY